MATIAKYHIKIWEKTMTLFIQTTDFKKIAQCEFENFYASYIDFDQQQWQFIQRPNEENERKKQRRNFLFVSIW